MTRPWTGGDPDAVARTVLAASPYHTAGPSARAAAASPFAFLWNWLADHVLAPLLGPLLRALAGTLRGAPALTGPLGLALIALALAACGILVVRLALAFARPAGRAAAPGAGGGDPLVGRSARQWRLAAAEAFARGDYRGAVAACFASALALLDEGALVALDGARTPGEYARLVRRAAAPASPAFDALAETFVRALYASDPVTATEAGAAERALAAFEPAVGR